MIISRLANAMKNESTFEQLDKFINNYKLLINYIMSTALLGMLLTYFLIGRNLVSIPSR